MTERGRQRSTSKNPSRESLVDKQVTDLIVQKSLIVRDIERVRAMIDNYLDTYNEDRNKELESLSDELSALNETLEEIEKKLT